MAIPFAINFFTGGGFAFGGNSNFMFKIYNLKPNRNLFNPKTDQPFKLSRSKLELFMNCPRCFYLDRRLGIGRPEGPAFTLNSAVDALLKKEFDLHREAKKAHPLMVNYGLKAVPFAHEKINDWRNVFKGLRVTHEPTNFLVYGAIDDLWLANGEIHLVDYKATSTENDIDLNDRWKQGYKRQMEIYQWLARRVAELADYKISNLGYFVYCNGRKDKRAFDGKLEFAIQIIPYQGDDSWVESAILEAKRCLTSSELPEAGVGCDFCHYRQVARQFE